MHRSLLIVLTKGFNCGNIYMEEVRFRREILLTYKFYLSLDTPKGRRMSFQLTNSDGILKVDRLGGGFVMKAKAIIITVFIILATAISIQADEYKLGPGDQLEISVWGQDEMLRPVIVRPDGRISFPLAGEILVTDLTPQQLARKIAQNISPYVQNPQVTVIVTRFKEDRFLILGQIKNPGLYLSQERITVLEGLVLAGGVDEKADLKSAYIIREKITIPVDLEKLLKGKEMRQNYTLEAGDIVYIPEKAETTIIILGQIQEPGEYIFRQGDKVLDLIGQAGGVTSTASLSRATLTRGNDIIPVNLERLLLLGDKSLNLDLQPGDMLFIPEEQEKRASVLGQVSSPGSYIIKGGYTLIDLISKAGGLTDKANKGDASLMREGKVVSIDLDELLMKGNLKQNIEVQAGDVLLVPELTEMERNVIILGQVDRPGMYPLYPGESLLSIILGAGGPTAKADLANCSLVRGRTSMKLDLASLFRSGDMSKDIELKEGDLLIIPELVKAETISLLGQIAKPGRYEFEKEDTLLGAIIEAGGVTDKADLANSFLVRGKDRVSLDLNSLLRKGDMTMDLPLQSGDLIIVPEMRELAPEVGEVSLLGQVAKPGLYKIREDDTLLKVVVQAGGVTDQADLSQASLVRRGDKITLNLRALLEEGDTSKDLLLQGGDLIVIPGLSELELGEVLVLGQIASPAAYKIAEGDTLLDIVTQAGGPTKDADLTDASLIRKTGKRKIDLSALLEQGDLSKNILLQKDDLIIVPRRLELTPETGEVMILGEVNKPGAYKIREGDTLLGVIVQAGGPSPQADLTNSLLSRDDRQIPLSLAPLLRKGDRNRDLRLYDGDLILIPQLAEVTPEIGEVALLGEVARPGLYKIREDDTLLKVIVEAGGTTDEADLSQASLVRGEEKQALELQALLKEGDTSKDLPLQRGDLIVIPKIPELREEIGEVALLGEVAKPGLYKIREDDTLLKVVVEAGGTTDEADLSQASLVRGEERRIINLASLLKGDMSADIPLQRNDLIIIPEIAEAAPVIGEVSLLGAINNPGAYEIREGDTLLEVIVRAGGPARDADLTDALLSRGDSQIALDLASLLEKGDRSKNLSLNNGDLILLPRLIELEPQIGKVSILGQVARPGAYEIRRKDTLLEVIVQAGGMTEKADLEKASLIRGEERISLDLISLFERGDMSKNIALEDRDLVIVPELMGAGEVSILGQVAGPGIYKIEKGDTLLKLILRAGGPSSDADLAESLLTRGEERIDIDLVSLLEKGDTSYDVPLESGDLLLIPRVTVSEEKVTLFGEVEKPGIYQLSPGDTLLDLITKAGGVKKEAQAKATIQRGIRTLSVDLERLFKQGDTSQNIPLENGDTIFVPEVATEANVFLFGQVPRPGSYNIIEGTTTLLDVIARAGGVSEDAYNTSAIVTRDEERITVDLSKLLLEGDTKFDVTLRSKDTIIIRKKGGEQVLILGQIGQPGSYPLEANETLVDIITKAGGPTEQALLTKTTIARENQVLERDVRGLLEKGDLSQNLPLKPNDLIFIPKKAEGEVTILGQVAKPGSYKLKERASLLDMLVEAGGPTERADLSSATLTRAGRLVDIDLDRLFNKGDASYNLLLQSGDSIFIPDIGENQILVLGQVNRPGAYEMKPGESLLKIITKAGGPAANASLSATVIGREEEGSRQVNLRRLLLEGDQSQDISLKLGDTIFIPEKTENRLYVLGEVKNPGVFRYEDYTTVLQAISLAGGVTDKAVLSRVRIIRGVTGEPQMLPADVRRLINKGDVTQDVLLLPGDVVFVPKTSRTDWNSVLKWVTTVVNGLNLTLEFRDTLKETF